MSKYWKWMKSIVIFPIPTLCWSWAPRRSEPGRERSGKSDLRHAYSGCLQSANGNGGQTQHGRGVRGLDNDLFLWIRPSWYLATQRKLWRIWSRPYKPVDPRRPRDYFGLIFADEKTASLLNEGMPFFLPGA
jgi:hypothetical protein